MDAAEILGSVKHGRHPVGLGGCRNHDYAHPCCEYNITVFDGSAPDEFFHDSQIRVHHASPLSPDMDTMVQYDSMTVLYDEQWELRMLLDRIRQNRTRIFQSRAESALLESSFCVTEAKRSLPSSPVLASCWLKSAALCYIDAVLFHSVLRPSPSHTLHLLRNVRSGIGRNLDKITESVGSEHASKSLLERMARSAVGLAGILGVGGSDIIQKKHAYMTENSMLVDCYYYLIYVNRGLLLRIGESSKKRRELEHVLGTAFDVRRDIPTLERQAEYMRDTASRTLVDIASKK